MDTCYEGQLLARTRDLADVDELAATIIDILGRTRNAGLDPGALGGLVGAAHALGADSLTTYAAEHLTVGRYADERQFLTHLADAEDDIAERRHAADRLHHQVTAALDAALDRLDEAEATSAVAEAERAIGTCEAALAVLDQLTRQLRRALARLRAVPGDLGETYESVYNLLRRGGVLPHHGRWITGQEPKAPATEAAP